MFNINSYAFRTCFFCLLFSVIALMYLKFPLVYQGDSGTYLYGFLYDWISDTRPIFYGIFVFFVRTIFNIYWLVIFQTILVSVLSFYALRTIVEEKSAYIITVISYLASAQPVLALSILPDVYVAPLFYCLIILFQTPNNFKIILLTIFILSLFHTSYSSVIFSFTLSCLFFKITLHRVEYSTKTCLYLLLVCLAAYIVLSICNYIGYKKFSPSLYSNIAIFSKLTEIGATKKFLNENEQNSSQYLLLNKAIPDKLDYNQIFWRSPQPVAKILSNGISDKMLDPKSKMLESSVANLNKKIISKCFFYIIKKIPACVFNFFKASKYLGDNYVNYPESSSDQKALLTTFGENTKHSRQQIGTLKNTINIYSFLSFSLAFTFLGVLLFPLLKIGRSRKKIDLSRFILLNFMFFYTLIYSLLAPYQPRYSAALEMPILSLALVQVYCWRYKAA